jgi:hypothetical protein
MASPIVVGDNFTLSSEFIYMTEVIIGDGINSSYLVSQTSDDYTKTNIDTHPEVISLTDTTITFNTVRMPTDIFVLDYYTITSDPFLEYIAKSYSGSLLGLLPLPSYPLLLRPSLYESMFSDSYVALMRADLNNYSSDIPPTYLEYCDTIPDKLEKILFMIYLYAIYAS